MLILTLLALMTLFLAYSNGANDNFKGVASLFGSRICSYRTAISWATVTTFAGVATASAHGLPVSTTHVSVGALLGIGITTHQAKWKAALGILLAWVVTLPCAAAISALVYWLVTRW